MLPTNLFDTIMNVSGVIRELEGAGMRIEIGDDFSIYRKYRDGQSGRGGIYPMFDAAASFIDATNGFWICGFDAAGELVHTQAARLYDLNGVSLGRHLDMHRHKYITPDTTPDPDKTYYSGPAGLARITGRVLYHGEFWMPGRGLGGPRSQGTTALLSRILFEIAAGSWQPDYLFALVPKQLASKGAHLRYGYTHCEPGQWVGPDGQITDEDYLIWMSAEDVTASLRRSPQGLAACSPVTHVKTKLESVN